MKTRNLKINNLKPALLINNNIEGEGFRKYNYEEYLVDFINNSKFVDDHGKLKYVYVKNQDNGEPDASNGIYSLDFKIFAEQQELHAKYECGEWIYMPINGLTMYGSRSKDKEMGYYNLFQLFCIGKCKTINDNHIDQYKQAIETANKILSTKKNILVLLPFEIFYDDKETNENIAKEIIEEIKDSLVFMYDYRKKIVNYETYVAFISDELFIIVAFKNNKPYLYDCISTKCSNLYNEIVSISNPF